MHIYTNIPNGDFKYCTYKDLSKNTCNLVMTDSFQWPPKTLIWKITYGHIRTTYKCLLGWVLNMGFKNLKSWTPFSLVKSSQHVSNSDSGAWKTWCQEFFQFLLVFPSAPKVTFSVPTHIRSGKTVLSPNTLYLEKELQKTVDERPEPRKGRNAGKDY